MWRTLVPLLALLHASHGLKTNKNITKYSRFGQNTARQQGHCTLTTAAC